MEDNLIVPPIKIQWIKTKLVRWIFSNLPNFTGKRIEPFMWSWVVWFNYRPKNAIFSDTNPHTINFYNEIKKWNIDHNKVRTYLEYEWAKLKLEWEKHYKYIRERFNDKKEPLDFLFLNRSDFNWMIRFNRKWWFNVPFGKKPERFAKAYVTKIVNQVHNLEILMKENNRTFICQDFSETIKLAWKDDLIYCDPPYIWRHVDYFDSWNEEDEYRLNALLEHSWAKFVLSTRHSNEYRNNDYIEKVRNKHNIKTSEHFYHLWAKEANRKPMLEAIIMNYKTNEIGENNKILITKSKKPIMNKIKKIRLFTDINA